MLRKLLLKHSYTIKVETRNWRVIFVIGSIYSTASLQDCMSDMQDHKGNVATWLTEWRENNENAEAESWLGNKTDRKDTKKPRTKLKDSWSSVLVCLQFLEGHFWLRI